MYIYVYTIYIYIYIYIYYTCVCTRFGTFCICFNMFYMHVDVLCTRVDLFDIHVLCDLCFHVFVCVLIWFILILMCPVYAFMCFLNVYAYYIYIYIYIYIYVFLFVLRLRPCRRPPLAVGNCWMVDC